MYNRHRHHKSERHECAEVGCPARACESANITVPVSVRAHSEVGNVQIECMGPAVITRNSTATPGAPYAVSNFTVSQRINVEVPVVFGAEASVGEGHVCYDSVPDYGIEPMLDPMLGAMSQPAYDPMFGAMNNPAYDPMFGAMNQLGDCDCV